jgi:hypothetical protein
MRAPGRGGLEELGEELQLAVAPDEGGLATDEKSAGGFFRAWAR